MDKKASHSQVQMAQNLILHKEGYSERKIGVKLHISKTVVHSAIKNSKKDGTFIDIGWSGRLMKTGIRDDYMKKHIATRSPLRSCNEIQIDSFACKRNKLEP